jgi:hypothetical protein
MQKIFEKAQFRTIDAILKKLFFFRKKTNIKVLTLFQTGG